MPKTTYVWDELSDNVIEEYEDGVLSVSYTHEPGLYGNLLSQHRNGVTSYYHFDGRGDTVALTDDSGNVTDTKEYDAWGNVTASTGSTVTPYLFGGIRGIQRMQALPYQYARTVYSSVSTGRRLSSQLPLPIGTMIISSYASRSLTDSKEGSQPAVTIDVSYGQESIGPKCGQYSYTMHVGIYVTQKWYDTLLTHLGVTASPELLIFQHFHEVWNNDGCQCSVGSGRCTRGSLNATDTYDYYEFIDWNALQSRGATHRFLPRSDPKTKEILNYAIGFADGHKETGYEPGGMCIDNSCGWRKNYQHIRMFWKDHTKHKKSSALIDFDSDNWGGGEIVFGDRRVVGNLKTDRPAWWDDVHPAFVVMALHENKYCCCPDSFDIGDVKHYWAGRKPNWWYY